MIAYHFTSTRHLPMILGDGQLRRTESNASATITRAGPDVVWLLDTPDLGGHAHGLDDAAMRRTLGLGRATKAGLGVPNKTEVRFTLDVDEKWTKRWVDWAPLHVEEDYWANILIRLGGGIEAAEHWLISFARIPAARWVAVENLTTGQTYTHPDMRLDEQAAAK